MEWRQQAITLTEANYRIALLAFHEQPIGIIEMSVDHLWQNAGYLASRSHRRRAGQAWGSRLLEKGLEILQQWGLAPCGFALVRGTSCTPSHFTAVSALAKRECRNRFHPNTILRSSKWRRHSPKASGTLEVRSVGLRCDIAALYLAGKHIRSHTSLTGMKNSVSTLTYISRV